jgi:hypothetical protein
VKAKKVRREILLNDIERHLVEVSAVIEGKKAEIVELEKLRSALAARLLDYDETWDSGEPPHEELKFKFGGIRAYWSEDGKFMFPEKDKEHQ